MNTKIKTEDFSFSASYPYFPNYDIGSKEITARQRAVLTELIYSKVSDPEAVEDRLQEMNSLTFNDAKKSIRDLTESKWS